jgi:HEAT repeat protein
LQAQQIRVLKRDLDHERQMGIPIAMQSPFKSAEEAVKFFKLCKTEADLHKVADWNAFISSSIADEAAAPLAKAVVDLPGDDATRQKAIWLIGEIGRKKRPLPHSPVPELIALLDHPTPAVRRQAMDSLAKFGSLAQAALPRLRQIMQRDLRADALFAAVAAKEINPSEEIGPQLYALYSSAEEDLRVNAAIQISKYLPPAEAKQFLTAQYELTTDRNMRESIAEAMNKINE